VTKRFSVVPPATDAPVGRAQRRVMHRAAPHPNEGDLYYIMIAVQKLVDEMMPPNEQGTYDYTPAILDRMQDVQDSIGDALGLPRRPLIPPDSGQ
jgi:hypothetical protein